MSAAAIICLMCMALFGTVLHAGDTTALKPPVVNAQSSKLDEEKSKSPTGAILRSLVFPGWGQVYNQSYLKAGAFSIAAVSVTSIIVWNDVKFSDAQTRYDALASGDPLKERTFKEKEFYRDQRDVAGLWLLGVYALAAVDAYVGAHLFNFDVSDKGVSWAPLPVRGAGSQTAASLLISVQF
ncbi:MAG: hypothetical protein RL156_949 [Bacteroidota bacterium]|jgi:hypothetical protein